MKNTVITRRMGKSVKKLLSAAAALLLILSIPAGAFAAHSTVSFCGNGAAAAAQIGASCARQARIKCGSGICGERDQDASCKTAESCPNSGCPGTGVCERKQDGSCANAESCPGENPNCADRGSHFSQHSGRGHHKGCQ